LNDGSNLTVTLPAAVAEMEIDADASGTWLITTK
jgi:hypothetical protein